MKHLHTYLFAVALTLFLVPFSRADAKVTLSSVSVSSSSVAPSATFTITGTAALTSTNPTSWRALSYYYDNNVAGEVCVNIPAHSAPPDATYIESITARAPATPGAHTVWVSAFYLADCFNIPGTGNPLSKSASIIVVAQTPVTVAAVSVADKVYDGATSSGATTACTLAGSPAGVTCSGVGTFVDKNVGTNTQVTVTGITLGGPNASLYSLAVTTATTNASITKAPLTVTASSASRAYGEENPVFTGTLTGFLAGEDAAVAHITGAASCATAATASTAVGTVPSSCTQGTLAASNYSFATFVPGTLTITQAAQSISFPPFNAVPYGAKPQTLGAQASSGLPVTYTSLTPAVCTASATTVSTLDTGTCIVRAEQGGDGNYTAAPSVEQSFNVEKAATTTTITCPSSVAYSGFEHKPCTANVTGPDLSQMLDVSYTPNVQVGDVTVSASYTGSSRYEASSGSATFTITPDITAPTIAAHADIVAEAGAPSGTPVTYTTPAVDDDVDTHISVSCLPVSGTLFALGGTVVTCTAADASGNTAVPVTFTVTVRDTKPPTLTLAGASSVSLTTPATFVDEGATWIDVVDGSGSVISSDSVDSSRPGIYILSYMYTDAAGNASAPALRTVTVNDGEAPVFTNVPNGIEQEAVSAAGAPVTFSFPLAIDAVDGETAVTCDHASGDTFPLGSTVVRCEATDAAGHTAYASWQVTVADTTPPVVTLVGEAGVTVDAGVSYTDAGATWSDAVDGTGTAQAEGAVDTTRPGIYTYVYTHSDTARNAATSVTRTVTVVDRGAPVLSDVPGDIRTEARGPTGVEVNFTLPRAHDAIDGYREVTCLPASGNIFALGKTDVVCVSSDSAHNEARSSFIVEVIDTTKPTIVLLGTAAEPLFVGDVYAEHGATWVDVVDGTGTVQGNGDVDATRAGTYTRTYSYTDVAGNASDALTRTIVVEVRPVVTANVTSGGGGVAGTVYTFASPATANTPLQPTAPSAQTGQQTASSPSTQSTQGTSSVQTIQPLYTTAPTVPVLAVTSPPTAVNERDVATEGAAVNEQEAVDVVPVTTPTPQDAPLPPTTETGQVLGASIERVAPVTPEPPSQPKGYTQVATTTVLYDFFTQNPLLVVLVLVSLAISGITGTALYRLFSEMNNG